MIILAVSPPPTAKTVGPAITLTSSYVADRQHQTTVSGIDDHAWFLTETWKAGEAEADSDIVAGRVEYFDNEDEFLNSL